MYKRQQVTIFSKDNLEYGKHTITVRATNTKSEAARNTKVEFDAFKVLDTSSVKPTSVSVGTKSGITTISKENSSVQMVATVLPSEVSNKEVTWSVNDSNIATIDENGLLDVYKRQAYNKGKTIKKGERYTITGIEGNKLIVSLKED